MKQKIVVFVILLTLIINIFNFNSVEVNRILLHSFATSIEIPDKYYKLQWALKNNGNFEYYEQPSENVDVVSNVNVEAVEGIDINFEKAMEFYKGGDREVIVAVIDTGADYSHEDLEGIFWTNTGEIPNNNIDDDKNGYVDDLHGWNFYDNNNEIYSDYETHGTHVVGAIAANINEIGVAGVVGSGNVKIMMLKVLGGRDETGYAENVVDAIKYAEKMGAKVCNLSFGTEENDWKLEEVIKNSKMLFVVAAGNGDTYTGTGYDINKKFVYPASYNFDNLIAVSNLRPDGNLSTDSNYSVERVDIAAPGSRILSTIDTIYFQNNKSKYSLASPYAYMSGTSMSVPMVVGVATMIFSKFNNADSRNVKAAILGGSRKLDSLSNKVKTGGMLDAMGAIEYYIEYNKTTYGKRVSATNTTIKSTPPKVKISSKKNGKFLLTVKDPEDDLLEVRYVAEYKNVDYFAEGKGKKLKLSASGKKSLSLKKGKTYTFFALDMLGNATIRRVKVM